MNQRLAVVDPQLCQPDKCQLECISVCPVNKLDQGFSDVFPEFMVKTVGPVVIFSMVPNDCFNIGSPDDRSEVSVHLFCDD